MLYTLEKAKYLRRIPTGNPSRPYRYIYRQQQAAPVARQPAQDVPSVVTAHEAGLHTFTAKLRALAPKARVAARVKTTQSIKDKLALKPQYKSARELQDVTGARIVHNSTAEVLATVAKIKRTYAVVTFDDYIDRPKASGYMSYHLIVRDRDGLQKEIQVRTEAQHALADWHHDIYKPITDEQKQVKAQHGPLADDYAKALWQWHSKRDRGQPAGTRPIPHPDIARVFGVGP